MNRKDQRIIITGGHMTPALAVLDNLLYKHNIDQSRISWIGHKHSQTGDKSLSAEYKEVQKRTIKFINLKTGKIWRKWTFDTFFKGIKNLSFVPIGFLTSFMIILKEKPRIVIAFGGYLSVPVIISAYFLKPIFKTKIYLHIQTTTIDLSTKINSKFVDTIFISWPNNKKSFKHKNVILTGNPIRKELFKKIFIKNKIFDNDLPVLLILGGNQGANTFNRRLRGEILEKYLKHTNIIHQTGGSTVTNDYKKAKKEYKHLPKNLQKRYKIFKFIDVETLNSFYNQTTLLLARAGANTVTEVMLKGVPTIFMPLPWAVNNEQLENAKLVEKTGLAKIFEFKEGLTPQELYKEVQMALEQTFQKQSFRKNISWKQAKINAQKLINTNATSKIATFILKDSKLIN